MTGRRSERSASWKCPAQAIANSPRKSRFYGEHGFTLLELMAAIAILGMGVVMAIRLFSGGLALAKASDDHTRKVLVAREKMTEALLAERLSEGTDRGVTDDGFNWTVKVSPYDEKRAATGIFRVVVNVDGPEARKNTFTLTTLKRVL